ncbi:hypothetical protein QBC40DRAFT_163385 [Triangularia verruculosa]|uniref:Uncharacterized protein n=1 Tax=Triangularia verruculosa TaxID=2587418 RepID=A0AAN6XV42_9PEZI|nr:hypothetical protein QBC40DRAFT_163385 [Triangularia verruculosa]
MDSVLAQLRTKALADYRARVSIDKLDAEHRAIFVRAINNVLSTEIAIFTYAQIIDGLPIGDVAFDSRRVDIPEGHPLDADHEELCPGAMEKAREVCPKWDPELLKFNPNVLNAFQEAPLGSKLFNTRLIELLASSLHQFGALLFQLDLCVHKGGREAIEAARNWKQPKPDWKTDVQDEDWNPPRCHWPFFYNPYYMDRDIYPEGDANIVGYWAEARILGGVAVFDRRAEESNGANTTYSRPNPPNVYLHPNRAKVTNRITQLLDEQQQALIDFLLLEDTTKAASSSPLPILVDQRNRKRFNWPDSIISHHIYRDIWERRPLNDDEMRLQQGRPEGEIDHPEILAIQIAVNQAVGNPIPEGMKRRLEEQEREIKQAEKKAKFVNTQDSATVKEGAASVEAVIGQTEFTLEDGTKHIEDEPTEKPDGPVPEEMHVAQQEEVDESSTSKEVDVHGQKGD